MKNESCTHVIIGGPKLEDNNIIYRRRKLLEYLAKTYPDDKVYWIYFNPNSRSIPGSISFPELPKKYIEAGLSNIYQIEIADYKYIIAFSSLLQKFLLKRVLKYIQLSTSNYLWFTLHRFSFLSYLVKWDKIIYDCSDNWNINRGIKSLYSYIKNKIQIESEKRIIKISDFHFASSKYLKKKVESISKTNCKLIENGFSPSSFGSINTDQKVPENICYVGSINKKKIDIQILFMVAKNNIDLNFYLVGPVSENTTSDDTFLKLQNLPNVIVEGLQPPSKIPGILSKMNIGLLPYKNNYFTKGIFPLKYYEYIAAGLRVIGCNLPNMAHLHDGEIFYHIESDYNRCTSTIREILETEPVDKNKITRLLKGNTWDKKFNEMIEVIK